MGFERLKGTPRSDVSLATMSEFRSGDETCSYRFSSLSTEERAGVRDARPAELGRGTHTARSSQAHSGQQTVSWM